MTSTAPAGVGVVVGAGGAIGGRCVRAVAGSVECCVLADLDGPQLAESARAVGSSAVPLAVDLSDPVGVATMVASVLEIGLPIRWVVLAAGSPHRSDFSQTPLDRIDEIFAINCLGPLHVIRGLLDGRWSDYASIVAIGSVSATRALPSRALYGATKAALEQACRFLAAELAPRHIRVNVVAPGVIDSPFLGHERQLIDAWVDRSVPAARAGSPDEVASVVRFLVLDAPPYLTGARITVDGGLESRA
jgi:2-hydroxycyclohexanecarboxyl-CoA dehydrogenase